ncbi:MAG: hypothetical protein RI935_415 [Candidatus Parcubacteria bacterium]|jgi:SsrA-binding protein
MRLIENKKLGMVYTVEETISTGMELFGFEVKSIRMKLGSLDGARIIIRGGEAFLVGAFIPPYQAANTTPSYDPYRTRKLLVTKKEIFRLAAVEQEKRLTLIPISLYLNNNLIKCSLGLCKKKQAGDKRENIKKDIARRELRNSD